MWEWKSTIYAWPSHQLYRNLIHTLIQLLFLETIMQLQDDRQTFLLPRPVWINDTDVTQCTLCNSPFNAIRRRVGYRWTWFSKWTLTQWYSHGRISAPLQALVMFVYGLFVHWANWKEKQWEHLLPRVLIQECTSSATWVWLSTCTSMQRMLRGGVSGDICDRRWSWFIDPGEGND